jgi:hypothetical protein
MVDEASPKMEVSGARPDSDADKGGGRSFTSDVSAWPKMKVARAIQHKMDPESRVALWASGRPLILEKIFLDNRLRWQTRVKVLTAPPILEWALILGKHSLLVC